MSKLKTYTAFILLFFTLISLGGAGFLHHHPFGFARDSCQACVLTNALSTIDIGTEPAVFGAGSGTQTITIDNYSIPYSDSSETSQSRAPPFKTSLRGA